MKSQWCLNKATPWKCTSNHLLCSIGDSKTVTQAFTPNSEWSSISPTLPWRWQEPSLLFWLHTVDRTEVDTDLIRWIAKCNCISGLLNSGLIPPGYGAAIVTCRRVSLKTVDPSKGNGLGPKKHCSALTAWRGWVADSAATLLAGFHLSTSKLRPISSPSKQLIFWSRSFGPP